MTGEARALLSTVAPSRAHRRLALAIILASAVIFLLPAPFAHVPLVPIAGFIPVYESALVLNAPGGPCSGRLPLPSAPRSRSPSSPPAVTTC